MCESETESIPHALFKCKFANEVWERWKECPVAISDSSHDFSDVSLHILAEGTTKDLEIMVMTAWSIWYSRNQRVHEAEGQTPSQNWNFASNLLQDHKEASNYFLYGPSACEISWKRPPEGVYKINTDGATSDDGRKSSIGVIIRDSKGERVAGLCKLLPGNYTVMETEIMAVEVGILVAKELELQKVITETDSLPVVQGIVAKENSKEVGHLAQGILSLAGCFSSWKIGHLKRDYNRVAHELAYFARCNEISQDWKGFSPPMLKHLTHLDCL